jgi:hypothetical protein
MASARAHRGRRPELDRNPDRPDRSTAAMRRRMRGLLGRGRPSRPVDLPPDACDYNLAIHLARLPSLCKSGAFVGWDRASVNGARQPNPPRRGKHLASLTGDAEAACSALKTRLVLWAPGGLAHSRGRSEGLLPRFAVMNRIFPGVSCSARLAGRRAFCDPVWIGTLLGLMMSGPRRIDSRFWAADRLATTSSADPRGQLMGSDGIGREAAECFLGEPGEQPATHAGLC